MVIRYVGRRVWYSFVVKSLIFFRKGCVSWLRSSQVFVQWYRIFPPSPYSFSDYYIFSPFPWRPDRLCYYHPLGEIERLEGTWEEECPSLSWHKDLESNPYNWEGGGSISQWLFSPLPKRFYKGIVLNLHCKNLVEAPRGNANESAGPSPKTAAPRLLLLYQSTLNQFTRNSMSVPTIMTVQYNQNWALNLWIR